MAAMSGVQMLGRIHLVVSVTDHGWVFAPRLLFTCSRARRPAQYPRFPAVSIVLWSAISQNI